MHIMTSLYSLKVVYYNIVVLLRVDVGVAYFVNFSASPCVFSRLSITPSHLILVTISQANTAPWGETGKNCELWLTDLSNRIFFTVIKFAISHVWYIVVLFKGVMEDFIDLLTFSLLVVCLPIKSFIKYKDEFYQEQIRTPPPCCAQYRPPSHDFVSFRGRRDFMW